ncbi:hypothetical protein DERP_009001 [Dermatophagoides pteronyssinus]|uniref:Uncharacterized protein n=1 Tax=Dermatophagoides pteronyssinus TaxID=6956 RepID=A0ABQ8JG70_DERPT|nr:hypothetical protein DERP_009001 [Dermatophagoides pteronyssinus]
MIILINIKNITMKKIWMLMTNIDDFRKKTFVTLFVNSYIPKYIGTNANQIIHVVYIVKPINFDSLKFSAYNVHVVIKNILYIKLNKKLESRTRHLKKNPTCIITKKPVIITCDFGLIKLGLRTVFLALSNILDIRLIFTPKRCMAHVINVGLAININVFK